jgi:hypothetical protein
MSYENLPPRVAKLIMREIKQLAKSPPDGVTFVPGDEDCLNEIFADIDGPGACRGVPACLLQIASRVRRVFSFTPCTSLVIFLRW